MTTTPDREPAAPAGAETPRRRRFGRRDAARPLALAEQRLPRTGNVRTCDQDGIALS
jgi:hypothetical protein